MSEPFVPVEEQLQDARRKLEACQAQFRQLLTDSGFGICFLNPDGTVLCADPQAAKVLRCLPDDLLGEQLGLEFSVLQAKQGELRLTSRDGRLVTLETRAVESSYNGKPAWLVGVRDAIVRRREEEALAHLTALLDSTSDAIIGIGLDGIITSWNKASEHCFGCRAYQALGQPLEFLVPEDRLSQVRQMLEEVRQGRGVEHLETVFLRRDDGRSIEVCLTAWPVRNNSLLIGAVTIVCDLTAQKRVELEHERVAQALKKSEERLNLALDAAGMGACDMDVATGKGIWSRQHFLLLGYPAPPEVSGAADIEQWRRCILEEDREQVLRDLEEAKREHKLFRSEHRVVRADNGQLLWVNVMGRFLYEDERAVRFIGVIFDVTEHKASDEALRHSELMYRLLFESVPQGVVYHDSSGKIVSMNPAAEAILGRGLPELWGKSSDDLQHHIIRGDGTPVPGSEHPAIVALRTGLTVQAEEMGVFNPRESRYRWIRLSAVPQFRPGEATPFQVYTMFEEITEQKAAQEKQLASEAKFRWLFEGNLIAIFFWDTSGLITQANQAFCNLLGYTQDECHAGRIHWKEITDPGAMARDLAALAEITQNGYCRPYEKEFISPKDGRKVATLISGALMAGSLTEGVAYAIDLTELKRTEEALRNSEATLKIAAEATGLGTFQLDPHLGTLTWSEISRRHYGVPEGVDASYDLFISLVHPDDRERVEHAVQRALDPQSGGTLSVQYRVLTGEGAEERILSARGQTYFNERGEPMEVVGTCLDITDILRVEKTLKQETAQRLQAVEELRRQERLLIDQSRLAAMGEMIGNIAHQWRQPLNTLALIVQELPLFYERDLFSREYLNQSVARAMHVISHMSQTIDGFRNFIQPGKEKVLFRASEILAKTIALVEAAFGEQRCRIEVEADDDIFIDGYPNEFSQVILNILVNARDALLEREVAQPRIMVRLFREQDKAVLTITDNAGGIPRDIIGRIFDPYFSTKGPEKGSGIGLFMSKTIIEKNMNGTLRVRNSEDGAEFRIEV